MKRYWKQNRINSFTLDDRTRLFLIENNSLSIDELKEHLPFSEDEIRVRRSVLGLVRRDQQMRLY